MWFIFFHFYFDFLFSWAGGGIFENKPPSSKWYLMPRSDSQWACLQRKPLLQDLSHLLGLGGWDSGWVDALCSAHSPFRLMALLRYPLPLLEGSRSSNHARTNRSLHKAFRWVRQSGSISLHTCCLELCCRWGADCLFWPSYLPGVLPWGSAWSLKEETVQWGQIF